MKKRTGSRLKRGMAAALLSGIVVLGNVQAYGEEEPVIIVNEENAEEKPEEVQVTEETQEGEAEEETGEAQEADRAPESEEIQDAEELQGEGLQETQEMPEDLFADSEGETQKADLLLEAEKNQETVRAGGILLYTVWVENTGETELQDLIFRSSFGEEELEAVWEDQEGKPLIEGSGGKLECGERRAFYLKILLSEDRTAPVRLTMCASAKHSGGEISRQLTDTAEITALKAEFQVTKTADRTMAVPGDRIFFQICIRNTGERTLHSILTTEKLQREEIPVEFLEKEGVTLNHARTRALISRIEPGHSFSLRAVATVPEKAAAGEMINQVTVVTRETGEYTAVSEAGVEILREAPEIAEPEEAALEKAAQETLSRPVSINPRTGDRSESSLWMDAAAVSLSAAVVFLFLKRKGCE